MPKTKAPKPKPENSKVKVKLPKKLKPAKSATIASKSKDSTIKVSVPVPDKRFRVEFLVGPNSNTEIVTVDRSILVKTSDEFRQLFEEIWDEAYVKNEEMIPLSFVNAEHFKMFVKLLPLDAISAEALRTHNLVPEQLFGLVSICKEFCIEKLENALETLSKDFFETFEEFVNSPEYLNLSSNSLKSMLSSVWIPLEEIAVFNIASIWAQNHCSQQKLEMNGENLRGVLRGSLYEIRFPLMTNVDFSKTVFPSNILTDKDKARILEYMVLDDEDRASFDAVNLGFKVKARQGKLRPYCGSSKVSTFRVFPDSEIINERQVCEELDYCNYIRPSSPIELLGVGFLGPIDGDAEYKVKLEVSDSDKIKTRIQAKKRQIFYVMFKKPVVGRGEICLSVDLKGPATQSFDDLEGECPEMDEKPIYDYDGEHDGVKFKCQLENSQIVEILYRKIPETSEPELELFEFSKRLFAPKGGKWC